MLSSFVLPLHLVRIFTLLRLTYMPVQCQFFLIFAMFFWLFFARILIVKAQFWAVACCYVATWQFPYHNPVATAKFVACGVLCTHICKYVCVYARHRIMLHVVLCILADCFVAVCNLLFCGWRIRKQFSKKIATNPLAKLLLVRIVI